MCSNVQDWVRAMGFGHFLSLPVLQVDRALLMALVERWSPVTYTFHLPMGEIEMPPIDFFMMSGFSMDGTPTPSSDDFNPTLVAWCIGPQPVAYYKGTKRCSSFLIQEGLCLGYQSEHVGGDCLL